MPLNGAIVAMASFPYDGVALDFTQKQGGVQIIFSNTRPKLEALLMITRAL
jgi:hypothetical protein